MTDFEFFIILLSFVVSLGVTTLLAGVARLVQESARVKFSWTYALWALAIFTLQITFWLKSYSYRDTYSLGVATALPPLVLAILAFFACGLATIRPAAEGRIDLGAFHQAQGRKYALAVAAFMLVSIVQSAIMDGLVPAGEAIPLDALVSGALGATMFAAAVFRRQAWVQIGAPLVFFIASLAYHARLIGW